ncbi:phage terminase large subunit family protein [Nitrobacter hamburgensis]|nr:phage terminase large subunit family protein [Nitrobacter hamburgensis]
MKLRSAMWSSLTPPPKLKLSEWIERNVHLPAEVSSLSGLMRLWRFQRDIADAIGDTAVERVTLVKSVRIGFTSLLTGAIASYCSNDPAPILALLPTESDCRRYVVADIEPIFDESPSLRGMLSDGSDESGRNTILARRFPGGSLTLVAAKAPRNLRAHNARVLFMDEVDGMEMTKEGPPTILAEKRTMSFADRKIVTGSTPIFEETSPVIRAYAKSDQRIFEVRCVECGEFHEIVWRDIHWPESEPEKAHWCCPGCGSVVEEKHKPAMVEAGRWRVTKPEVVGHAGFRVNALVSPHKNAAWGILAKEFLEAKSDPGSLQIFVNTILAEGWREEGEELDEAELSTRAELFGLVADENVGCTGIPELVMVITAGVDVQRKDRLEVTFVGWDEAGNAYVLGHTVIWGSPEDETTWSELDSVLGTKWSHPLGGKIGIEAACVDSGDGETMESVYAFCFPRARKKVLAIKGVNGTRPWIERSKQKIKGGYLWIVGVDGIKSTVYSRLRRSNMIRFSRDLPTVWYEQLASERVVVRYSRGQPARRFERISGKDAEALDCTVYAFAARQVVNVNWAQRREVLRTNEPAAKKPRERWAAYK